MANNYCQSSSFIAVPHEKLERARRIVEEIETKLETGDEDYVGFVAEVEKDGVWIYDDEYISPEHVERLFSALVNELDLPGVHVCSWAYTCSKPRIDEFGGGAFAVQKGRATVWVDAASEARRIAELTPNAKLSGGTPSAQVTCSACGGTGQDDPPPGKYHGLCQKCKGTGKQNAESEASDETV